jgi:hypothetical protein|tara:strand:- start:494 stop:817 length:324 start_codon:yes stop_codon:yes gene_type:complete
MPASEEYQAEVEQRVNRVARLIANGARRSDVLQMCAERWGLKDRQADLYLERARKKLKADYDMDRPQMLADLLAQLSTIQMEARRTGNLNIALGAVNTAAKLTQLVS